MRSDQFTHLQALEYVDYLKRERKYSSKTCNDTVGYLKTLFFILVERDIIKSNPFCKIKKSKEEKGKNVAFTPGEIDKVIKYMKIHNERFYYATQFVRYVFIRRTELMYLKVHHISIENQTITIPSEVSKTGKQDSITIPRSLEKVIKEMNLDKANPYDYLFGKSMETCNRRIGRVADFSLEHTGCIELYRIVRDPYVVCRQCRHSDIKNEISEVFRPWYK